MINFILIGSIDPLGLIDGIDLPIPLEFLKMLPALWRDGTVVKCAVKNTKHCTSTLIQWPLVQSHSGAFGKCSVTIPRVNQCHVREIW